MIKTKKKDFDKFLRRLFSIQKSCFKKGSRSYIEVKPVYNEDDNDFTIHVTAFNKNVVNWIEHDDGTKEPYQYENFSIYSFYTVAKNDATMQKIMEYVNR